MDRAQMSKEKTSVDEEAGTVWNKRYVIRRCLGAGASARVWLAYDKIGEKHVALKHFELWKGNEYQCRKEIKNLEFLSQQDTDGGHITKLVEVFYKEGRPCLVIDFVSGTTLKQEIARSKKRGVAMAIIRKTMECVLKTFEFMASSKVDMLHGDLKPDNVILHDDENHVQLIDFGLANHTGKMQKNMYIQSRWYRSPEVLLGLPATAQVDMWSIGCLLVELFAGVPPFRGYDSFDQMMLIVDAIGMPGQKMRDRCEDVTLAKLDELGAVVAARWAKVDKEAEERGKPVESTEQRLKRRLLNYRKRRVGESEAEREHLVDLVCKLLVNDPTERLTPTEALKHPFLVAPPRILALSTSQGSLSANLSLPRSPSPSDSKPQQGSPGKDALNATALSRLSSCSTVTSSISPELPSVTVSGARTPGIYVGSSGPSMPRIRASKDKRTTILSNFRFRTPSRRAA